VKPALLVESNQLLKKKRDPHHTVKGTTGNIVSVVENQEHLELVPFTNGRGTASVRKEPIMLSYTHHVPLYLLWDVGIRRRPL
jgi:hypothetical protein